MPAAVPAPAEVGAEPSPVRPATFVRVAQWKQGAGLAVDEAAVRDLPEGTMVFITKP